MRNKNLKPDVVEIDVTWLAREWEGLLRGLEYPTRAYAVNLLLTLAQAFLRGRGMRTGSPRGFALYTDAQTYLTCRIISRVVGDEASGIWFPTLLGLGFTSDREAEEILRENLTRGAR